MRTKSVMNLDALKETFQQLYGDAPRYFSAPGRVNLIGEHTDYNDGFVLPVAINYRTTVAASLRNDNLLKIYSQTLDSFAEIDLSDELSLPNKRWVNYVGGVAYTLKKRGANLKGANLLITTDVPVGAGLSSSAALEISTGYALLSLAGEEIDKRELALTGQQVEHNYVGIKSGIMDQLTSCLAKADHALLIDCRSLEIKYIPLNSRDFVFVVCNSGVKHELASSEYNTRRTECEWGVAMLKEHLPNIKALRDVSVIEFKHYEKLLPEPVKRRCRHVITENERTLAATEALSSNDFTQMGELMVQSHNSLRDDYEVSCKELDILVEIALKTDGVYGARMTGGGFGGSTVNLVKREAIEQFQEKVFNEYKAATQIEPAINVIEASDGVKEIEN